DGAFFDDVAGNSADGVEDAHAALEAVAAHVDELRRRTLEPGRAHPAVLMPDGGEPIPEAGVAPQDPVLDQLPDLEFVSAQHVSQPSCARGRASVSREYMIVCCQQS